MLPHPFLPLHEMYASLLFFPGLDDPAIHRADQHMGRSSLRVITRNYFENVKDLILLVALLAPRPFACQTTSRHRSGLLAHGDLNGLLHSDVRLFGQLGLLSGLLYGLPF